MNKKRMAIFLAILAAVLYAINVPFSKLLLVQMRPSMLAGFLYMGAGVGIGILMLGRMAAGKPQQVELLSKKELPYVVAMVILDIVAPIFLMYGIMNTTSANVSLLNNFEIVATSIIALLVFKEKITPRLWLAIGLVTISGVILGFEGAETFAFNRGSLFVLAACLCWGVENNCTRSISDKSSEEIVLIKGLFSGTGSIVVALLTGEAFPQWTYIAGAMLLGFVAYGLSINFYVQAQQSLGAAKTSAFYSLAPFLGVGFSFAILGEVPQRQFYVAFVIMVISAVLMIKDTLGNEKMSEEYVHIHEHKHGDMIHTHAHRHYVLNPIHVHMHTHV